MTGGRENDYSASDLYITSKSNDGIMDNITGVSAGYSMYGQNLFVQYLQQTDADQTPLTDKKVIGLAYYGDFADQLIVPIISYHRIGTNRVGDYDNRSSAGVRVNVANFIIEADYLMLEQEKLSALGDAKLNSMVAHIHYTHDHYQPFVKFIKEDGKKGYQGIMTGAENSERSAWEVGMEYRSLVEEEMRCHLVYNHSESELQSPTPMSKIKEQKIYAGIAFNYNILK